MKILFSQCQALGDDLILRGVSCRTYIITPSEKLVVCNFSKGKHAKNVVFLLILNTKTVLYKFSSHQF